VRVTSGHRPQPGARHAAPDPCHILEAHLTSNNAALKAAIVEAAVASVQAKEVLLLGVVCPPVQSEFLSIVASLVPFSFGLKERSTRWVSSLRMKPGALAPPRVWCVRCVSCCADA
jgi:hypothetical protein